MLFNSHEFLLVFLPAALVIYGIADKSPSLRTWVLIALSLVFYGYWDVRFLPLLVGSILVNWGASIAFKWTKRQGVIVTAILANLALLGLFKYVDFALQNISGLTGVAFEQPHWALPLGISFFTFHHVMYLVDLGKGRAPVFPLDRYALYICFFPQAIAGPIARWSEVMHQFGQRAFAPGWEKRAAMGTTLVLIGLVEKTMIADPLSSAIDPIYAAAFANSVAPGSGWMALAFAFQGFFDFSAYSDIAIGLGLIFGVVLPLNFNGPFRASSILEFWQCWHMTLARFLRDYVFTPLTRLRIGGTSWRSQRVLAALIVTMALCGLWHGAGWTFIVWGTLQGFALAFAAVWRRYLPSPPKVVGWFLTIVFFVISSVIFRAGSLEAAWHIYESMTTLPSLHPVGRNALIAALIVAVALPPSHEICRRLTQTSSRAVAAGLALAAVSVLAVVGNRENYQFIYFQF